MSPLTRVALLAAAAAASLATSGCGDGCRELATADVTGGKVSYTTAEGRRLETTQIEHWGTWRSGVELRGQLGARPFRIVIDHLTSGETRTLPHDESAKLCLPLADRASPTCMFLDGTVETRKLRVDHCEGNENITLCEEQADLTIRATSHDLGLDVAIDATVLMQTKWNASECAPD